MATPVEYYLCCGMCSLLGVMFGIFGAFNLVHNTGVLGSFGHKFGYEMDVVMGGLLGLPHYSKVECLMLTFACVGAFLSWSSDPTCMLITALGLCSAGAYMAICGLYAYYAKLWKQEGAPFVVMSLICVMLDSWRFTRFGVGDTTLAITGVCCFGALIAVAWLLMMCRAPGREQVHDRFVLIFEYCESNKDFVWLSGKDAPEGFDEKARPKESTALLAETTA